MHASGADVTGMGGGVIVCVGVDVDGSGVCDGAKAGVDVFDGIQAATSAMSVKSIVVCFIA